MVTKIGCCGLFLALGIQAALAEQTNVFARFKMTEPTNSAYYVQLGGFIHGWTWYLSETTWPRGANTNVAFRVRAGEFTPWFNLRELESNGGKIHGRLNRSGGVAELPNITADFIAEPPSPTRKIEIELATAPDEQHVAKRFEESYTGSKTSFLVSPDLARDAADLETASQMTERHLRWAREATGGKAVGPKKLILATAFWAPQRPELNLKEAEAVHQLGFNTINPNLPEALAKFDFGVMAINALGSRLDPAMTRDEARKEAEAGRPYFAKIGARLKGVSMLDEIGAPPFARGTNLPPADAVANFHDWLAQRGVKPEFLGVQSLAQVRPLDTPRDGTTGASLTNQFDRRVFYLTCRFRQESAAQRLQWMAEEGRKIVGTNVWLHTMPADHPFFGGAGMGYRKTADWGEWLSCDWFDLARRHIVDSLGIEDWLGLKYMYGSGYTWDGFQLLGFMANISRSSARSAGRDEVPMIGWITPSDERNLRLKASSLLAHGCKNFFIWTYGPTATSTENYWSDLRSEYDGVADLARQLAAGEDLLEAGRLRPTRLALLYSISSDIWQPFNYTHMSERRLTWFSLIHDQYPVDFLSEEDIEAGRLSNYDALYVTDPCVANAAADKIAKWVRRGGFLYGSCAAGSRDEYNEPASRLSEIFGIRPDITVSNIPGSYWARGYLNQIPDADRVRMTGGAVTNEFGVLGIKATITPMRSARIVGTYTNGAPAVVENRYGRGRTRYFATCPAISYAKDAKFVRDDLKEKWPPTQRRVINQLAREARIKRPVELSVPVVEAGLYDSAQGLALVLANYTYEPVSSLEIAVRQAGGVRSVTSVERGDIPFQIDRDGTVRFTVALGLNDLVLLRRTP